MSPMSRSVATSAVMAALMAAAGLMHCGPQHAAGPQVGTQAGSFVFFETPVITHTRDYYAFGAFISDSAPTNWLYPVNYRDGMWRLTVDVISMKDSTALPIYYTVTWSGGIPNTPGFLRAAVKVDHGPGRYESYAKVKDIEWSPDGSCCQTIGDKYWPWENAWAGVGGDLVAMAGGDRTFPVTVKAKLTFYSTDTTASH